MKTLICLSSLIRNFEIFWASFEASVLSRLVGEVHLIGHFPPLSTKSEQERVTSILSAAVERCRVVFEPDPALSCKQMSCDRHMAWQNNGIRGNLLQWHSMKQLALIEREFTGRCGPYDQVFWSRPDLLFLYPIEDTFPSNTIKIPSVENWWGYHDRFCYGPPDFVRQRLHILDYFLERWYPAVESRQKRVPHSWLIHWIDLRSWLRCGWNAESVLRDFLDSELRIPVKRTTLLMARVHWQYGQYFIFVPRWALRYGDPPIDDKLHEQITQLLRLRTSSILPKHLLIPLRRVVDALPHLEYLRPFL